MCVFYVQVFTRAMLGCVAELQTSVVVSLDFSPAWIVAAAKHFVVRLDTLCHIFLLQPELAASVFQQVSKREVQEMVKKLKTFEMMWLDYLMKNML